MIIVNILGVIALFVFGSILGSFACCQAWRIHFKEQGKKSPGKWSICMSCGKRLTASENIPVISWLVQRGKCKKCGAKIGKAEILSELSLGLTFLAFGALFWGNIRASLFFGNNIPQTLTLIFIMLLLIIALVAMWILAIYDAKWQKLPTFLLTILNACAIMYIILRGVGSTFDVASTFSPLLFARDLALSAFILAGPYFLLSTLSKEKLVGSGDWLVALPIALILGNWWLALVALFVANFTGSIYGLYQKIRYKKTKFPFAPFLVVAFVITYCSQSLILSLAGF